ncbi:MAG: bifunctional adenosylcobinamide kinase/adenosylcobinamide-phosphate guanylyltransferase [Isosphaeraceae bacterium]|nr:bifunctional adenosylcobinamide kinase/adenosylcobinamide-phosphate guanylyltransferase [Isosphaeraceae bacterium]
MGETILILGGARSGKSRMAAKLAQGLPPVTYVATATVDQADPEMVTRIARHQTDRPAEWTTLEVPRELEGTLSSLAQREGSLVIDCATLWLTNLILGLGGGQELDNEAVLEKVRRAASALRGPGRVIWVSNEVGSGIVPMGVLTRRFVDLQGLVNQELAEHCDQVYLCVAGIPLRIKGSG